MLLGENGLRLCANGPGFGALGAFGIELEIGIEVRHESRGIVLAEMDLGEE